MQFITHNALGSERKTYRQQALVAVQHENYTYAFLTTDAVKSLNVTRASTPEIPHIGQVFNFEFILGHHTFRRLLEHLPKSKPLTFDCCQR